MTRAMAALASDEPRARSPRQVTEQGRRTEAPAPSLTRRLRRCDVTDEFFGAVLGRAVHPVVEDEVLAMCRVFKGEGRGVVDRTSSEGHGGSNQASRVHASSGTKAILLLPLGLLSRSARLKKGASRGNRGEDTHADGEWVRVDEVRLGVARAVRSTIVLVHFYRSRSYALRRSELARVRKDEFA